MKTLTIEDKLTFEQWAGHDCSYSRDSGCSTCEEWYEQSHKQRSAIQLTEQDRRIIQQAYDRAKLKYTDRYKGDEDATKNYEAINKMEDNLISRL